MKKAIVLLSGGLDSTTCLAYAQAKGYECEALSFDYGQRHHTELNAAKKIAAAFGVKHHIFKLNINQFGGSALTDENIAVPENELSEDSIPVTYVPARNTIFLSIALGFAETSQAAAIFIGVSAIDYSNYPDCRPEFIAAFQALANLATKAGVEQNSITIETPLIHLTKAETIDMGLALGVDYSLTVSCYQANAEGQACGVCASCQLRKKGFAEAGQMDTTRYHTN